MVMFTVRAVVATVVVDSFRMLPHLTAHCMTIAIAVSLVGWLVAWLVGWRLHCLVTGLMTQNVQ